eukprot:scaffold13313_cov126-Isochrysis_galbana.AAC.4
MYVRQTTASYLSYAPATAYLPTSLQYFFKNTPSLELELEAEAAGGQAPQKAGETSRESRARRRGRREFPPRPRLRAPLLVQEREKGDGAG